MSGYKHCDCPRCSNIVVGSSPHERRICRDKVDHPAWLDSREWSAGEIDDLCHGGCASGCYMPAVTYHVARETMAEHGDSVLEYIEGQLGELPAIPTGESWSGIAVHFLSTAVELWASGVQSAVENGEDVLVPEFCSDCEEWGCTEDEAACEDHDA